MEHLSKQPSTERKFKLRPATKRHTRVLESQLSLRELDRKELLERLTPLLGEASATSLLEGKAVDLELSPDQEAAVQTLMPRVARFVRGG